MVAIRRGRFSEREVVVNLDEAAKEAGVYDPPSLPLRADKLIE